MSDNRFAKKLKLNTYLLTYLMDDNDNETDLQHTIVVGECNQSQSVVLLDRSVMRSWVGYHRWRSVDRRAQLVSGFDAMSQCNDSHDEDE